LRSLYAKIDAIKPPKPNLLVKSERAIKKIYFSIAGKEWFIRLVTLFFIAVALVNFFALPLGLFFKHSNTFDYLSFIASFAAAVYTILGVLKIRTSRLSAYRHLKQSLLISIFVVQVFTFYKEQFSGFIGLVFNILLLVWINFMIEREKHQLKPV
jgi:hypothetical protein